MQGEFDGFSVVIVSTTSGRPVAVLVKAASKKFCEAFRRHFNRDAKERRMPFRAEVVPRLD